MEGGLGTGRDRPKGPLMPKSHRRRLAAALTASSLAFAAVQCGGPSTAKPLRRSKQRVFVMGFDGMDPTLTSRWMDEGKLPNLKKLSEEGVYRTLGSSMPSESPTAWSSFATGVNPGKHNIYDFLIRDLETYLPDFNMIRKEPPEVPLGPHPDARGRRSSRRAAARRSGSTPAADGDPFVVLTVPGHVPARAHRPRRDALGPAAARHPRHARDVLLLGHRPARLRGGQHRVRRHPEAAALRRRRLARPCSRAPTIPILKQEEAALEARKKAGASPRSEQAPRRARERTRPSTSR